MLGYDKNGFIASKVSVVFKAHTENKTDFDFDNSKWYRKIKLNGKEVYITEAFLTDPVKFCGVGRTKHEFEREGTGDRIWIYNREGEDIGLGAEGKMTRIPVTLDGVKVKVKYKFLLHESESNLELSRLTSGRETPFFTYMYLISHLSLPIF